MMRSRPSVMPWSDGHQGLNDRYPGAGQQVHACGHHHGGRWLAWNRPELEERKVIVPGSYAASGTLVGERRETLRLEPVRAFALILFDEDLHAKRVESLANGMAGVLNAARFTIHAIGQAYAAMAHIEARSGVNQLDRLLSNVGVKLEELFPSWIRVVVSVRTELIVSLDGTEFDADDHVTLCAYARHATWASDAGHLENPSEVRARGPPHAVGAPEFPGPTRESSRDRCSAGVSAACDGTRTVCRNRAVFRRRRRSDCCTVHIMPLTSSRPRSLVLSVFPSHFWFPLTRHVRSRPLMNA